MPNSKSNRHLGNGIAIGMGIAIILMGFTIWFLSNSIPDEQRAFRQIAKLNTESEACNPASF